MTEKEIRRLNRQDLLVLLAEQTTRANQLAEKLTVAEEQLKNRNLLQQECGSMAEASLRMADIFRSADEAATLYIENVKRTQNESLEAWEAAETARREKVEEMFRQSEEEAVRKSAEAEKLLQQAREQAAETVRQAQETAEQERKKTEELILEAQLEAEEIVRIAQETADRERQKTGELLQKARLKADEIVSAAQEEAAQERKKAEELIRTTQQSVKEELERIENRWTDMQSHWAQIQSQMNDMEKNYAWLRGGTHKNSGG